MVFKLSKKFLRAGNGPYLEKVMLIDASLNSPEALAAFPDADWPATAAIRAAFTAKVNVFKLSCQAAADGGKTARDQRAFDRSEVDTMVRSFIPHLEAVAEAAGNLALLDLTGMDHLTPPSPLPQDPPAAPPIKATHGTVSGTVRVRVTPAPKGIGTWEGQKCTGDPSVEANWQTVIIATKASKIDFTGLTPGQLTYFRVRGINGHPGAWSDVASLIVL